MSHHAPSSEQVARLWAREHAPDLIWDNVERQGRMPARRRSGADVGIAADMGAGLVDESKLIHPRRRQRIADGPVDDLDLRAYRDRLRSARGIKAHKKIVTRKLVRRPTQAELMAKLTPEGFEKWDEERQLDRALAHHTFDDEKPYGDGAKADQNGEDGGWGRRVGIRRADKILAQKHARQRVEAVAEAYVEQGRELADVAIVAREIGHEQRISDIDQVMYDQVPVARIWLGMVNAFQKRGVPREGAVDAADRTVAFELRGLRDRIVYLRQFLREPEHPEITLQKMAREEGVTVPILRDHLVRLLEPLRGALREMAGNRDGHGLGEARSKWPYDSIRTGPWYRWKPPQTGRPRQYDYDLASHALIRADAVSRMMGRRAQIGVAGGLIGGIRPSEVGVAMYFASTHIPGHLSLYESVVLAAKIPYGRRDSLANLSRAAVSQMTGVPVEAMNALIKASTAAAPR